MLEAAAAAALDAAPHLASVATLLPRMGRRVRCSQNLRTHSSTPYSSPLALDVAVTVPWITPNHPLSALAILIDIDHPDGPERVDDLRRRGCPVPHLVLDPWSGRSHAILVLRTPVHTGDEARPGPRWLLDRAAHLLAHALGGDVLPATALVKNPFGLSTNFLGQRQRRGAIPASPILWNVYRESGSVLAWHTIPGDHAVELRDVVKALRDDHEVEVRPYGDGTRERLVVPRRGARLTGGSGCPARGTRVTRVDNPLGRNCTLFDTVRFFAYRTRERDGSVIQAVAEAVNSTFSSLLPRSAVIAPARSITRLMNRQFGRWRHGFGRRRRGLALDAAKVQERCRRGRDARAGLLLVPTDRQALAGRVTAAGRRARTDEVIAEAAQAIWNRAELLTQEAVATETGFSLRTVASRWHVAGLAPTSPWTDMQNGAQSGDAPFGGDTLAKVAVWQRHERTLAVAARQLQVLLEAVAVRLRQRGAELEALPAVSADLRAYPGVAQAERAAVEALASASRRGMARQTRQQQKARHKEADARYRILVRTDRGVDAVAAELTNLDLDYARRVAKTEDPTARRNLVLGWKRAVEARTWMWFHITVEETVRRAEADEPERQWHFGRRFGPPDELWRNAIADLDSRRPRRGPQGTPRRRGAGSRRG